MDLDKQIRKFALQNAVKFKGKANAGAVIGRLLSENAELRSKTKEVAQKVQKIVKEVNALSAEKQKKELEGLGGVEKKKKKEKKKELPKLPNAVEGKVVTRIAPEPSKYNHFGHALSFLFNYLYAKKYKGKCYLRFEDTNPEKAKQEYVDAMKHDVLDYLDIKPDKTFFESDSMKEFYKYAEQLIEKGKAYTCKCNREEMQDLRHKGINCMHKTYPPSTHLDEWKKMLKGEYKESEITLRLAIDMNALNQAMRDPVIFRISKTPHYRQKRKYNAWPMYDFANVVEANIEGITHLTRSNEFGGMRGELQNYIADLFGFKKRTIVEYGRFNILGGVSQGREIRELIEKKEVIGWDDPRLVTLKALRRRGIVKETYYELVYEVGLTQTKTNLDVGVVEAINRKILDPKVFRYFFVKDPKKVKIKGAPEQKIELDLHPENKKGGRKFTVKEDFYITKQDFDSLKNGKLYRLMDCLNFTKKGNDLIFDSLEHSKYKDKGEKIMHFLPIQKDLVEVEVFMPDATYVKGLGEPLIGKLKADDIVQLERFGFCRADSVKKDKVIFWYGHK